MCRGPNWGMFISGCWPEEFCAKPEGHEAIQERSLQYPAGVGIAKLHVCKGLKGKQPCWHHWLHGNHLHNRIATLCLYLKIRPFWGNFRSPGNCSGFPAWKRGCMICDLWEWNGWLPAIHPQFLWYTGDIHDITLVQKSLTNFLWMIDGTIARLMPLFPLNVYRLHFTTKQSWQGFFLDLRCTSQFLHC